MSRKVKFGGLALLVLSVAIAGLALPATTIQACVTDLALPSSDRLGWYKDYTLEGAAVTGDGSTIRYTPVLLYQSKRDNFGFRRLLRFFWHLGYVSHAPDSTVCSVLDAFSLERLETRIRQAPDRYPPGTMFFAGSEPGYRWADDDRTPREIVDDSRPHRQPGDGFRRDISFDAEGYDDTASSATRRGRQGVRARCADSMKIASHVSTYCRSPPRRGGRDDDHRTCRRRRTPARSPLPGYAGVPAVGVAGPRSDRNCPTSGIGTELRWGDKSVGHGGQRGATRVVSRVGFVGHVRRR